MSSIAKRDVTKKDKNGNDKADSMWRARYRDDAGKEHAKHFARKVDATAWLSEITTSIVTGQYVKPSAGRMTFKAYAESWRVVQVHRPTSRAHVETMLRRHAYPSFGDRPLSSILPSDIQAWISGLTKVLAPSTVQVAHGIVSGVFRAAISDRKLIANPCADTKLPKKTSARVKPLDMDVVERIEAAAADDWRAAVVLAEATGMRQGEVLGLTLDRVDFLRRIVTVDRQLITVPGRPPFLGPPKTDASVREIPLPQVAIDALAAHVQSHAPRVVEVEWERPEKAVTVETRLVFTDNGHPWSRQQFGRAWRRAIKAASDCPRHRVKARDVKAECVCLTADFHELRHFYASLLIRHGESVKTVQARLGHASAAETLDTYSHMWPDSDDTTRDAIDAVLGGNRASKIKLLADSVRTRPMIN